MTPQKNTIFCGGNLEVVSSWPSNFISAIVTDPPYGIGFMNKDWDTYSDSSLEHYHKDHSFAGNKRPKKASAYTTRATAAGSYDFTLQGQINFYNWMLIWAKAMLRITKPGGFLLCFGGTRTYHRLTCAIEDAGWEIRDCMMWLYGSGFPKSHNISKAIDKAKGVKPVGKKPAYGAIASRELIDERGWNNINNALIMPETQTPLAQLWEGYGTALKPAWEPIIVAMKPLDGTFAHNAERHGIAGLNIDAARVGTSKNVPASPRRAKQGPAYSDLGKDPATGSGWNKNIGRWPANLILDETSAGMLDLQTGTKKSSFMAAGTKRQMSDNPNKNTYGKFNPDEVRNDTYGDSGGASRFFYVAKTSRKERNMGMENCEDKLLARSGGARGAENRGESEYLQKSIDLNRVAVVKNNHPTVKPLALMKYLCTLLKMPGSDQIILDPFLGSGTTGITCKELGIDFIGIEKEREYCEIAVKRITAVPGQEITLHAETPLPVTKNVETDEQRQKIINAASMALRNKRS